MLAVLVLFPSSQGWGDDAHTIVCKIAQSRLSDSAAEGVRKLLPDYAEDLASLCLWPDEIKRHARRHCTSLILLILFAITITNEEGDCKDVNTGESGRCVVGAINNYTNHLLNYGSDTTYNLTEALLFLSHFIGDIHQPLHCGFVSDLGGNKVKVYWYTMPQNLHRVWDDNIIETAEERFYDSSRAEYVNAIQQNITKEWTDEVKAWENCGPDEIPCPDIYASESIEAACKWAYEGVTENSVLADEYFLSRLPIVTLRIAQAGVRLAASLNRIFDTKDVAVMISTVCTVFFSVVGCNALALSTFECVGNSGWLLAIGITDFLMIRCGRPKEHECIMEASKAP
ncbi:hypothetical protein VNO77_39559 [Canavalia gladiata]|uniref:Aspergillus nuclease S1 n=1 Tax=Canavalia gladiata TaxID=3824 RepID=A0AAN9JWN6_CANGL